MAIVHPALIHDGDARGSVAAEVQRIGATGRAIPDWNGVRLAQSSSGPSSGVGSSAGPVSGNINPYTATPGSNLGMSGSDTDVQGTSATSATSTSTSSPSSPSSRSAGRAAATKGNQKVTQGVPATPPYDPAKGATLDDDIDSSGPGPAGLDKGTSPYSNAGRGAGLMSTGSSVTAPPPPSLTDSDKTSPKPRPSSTPASAPTPPPPPPVETGSSSTR